MTSAITAVVLVAPQPRTGTAVELLALAAISGAALFVLDRRAGHDAQSSVARYIERASPTRSRPCSPVSPGSPCCCGRAAVSTG